MIELYFIGALLFSLLVGQFGRIELFGKLVNGYIQDPFVFLFLVFLMRQYGLMPLRNIARHKAALFFALTVLLSFVLSLSDYSLVSNAVALLYLVRIALYVLLGVYLHTLYNRKKTVVKGVERLLGFFSIGLLLFSVVQYFFFSDFWGLYAYGWDPHLYRMSATYIDVYVAAAIYGIFSLYWYRKQKLVLSLLFMTCLVFTFSRSAYVSFILSVLVFFLLQKKWKELSAVLIIFVLFVVLVPKPFGEGVSLLRTASVNSRMRDYQMGITIAQKKPILGYGYNRIRYAKEKLDLAKIDDRSHAVSSFHSSFLIILVTTGIVGFVLSLFLLFQYGMHNRAFMPILLYICSMSLFDNVLLHAFVLLPVILIGALSYQSSLE